MHNWPAKVLEAIDLDGHCVVITVTRIRGSAPRETGSKLWVSRSVEGGTIGGGYLELTCQRWAREVIDRQRERIAHRRFALGSDCGQCCGGVVDVMLQCLDDSDRRWLRQLVHDQSIGASTAVVTDAEGHVTLKGIGDAAPAGAHLDAGEVNAFIEHVTPAPLVIAIFGAGHVGRACAQVFATLDATVTLIDNREHALAGDWPQNVSALLAHEPQQIVTHLPDHAECLVMTHDHGIDLDICHALLSDSKPRFCGLIGSRSKQRRFDKKLKALGHDTGARSRIVCPIGMAGIRGKQPGEIAISVAADMLSRRQTAQSAGLTLLASSTQGLR